MFAVFGFSTLYGPHHRHERKIDRPPAAVGTPLDAPPVDPDAIEAEARADHLQGTLVEPPALLPALQPGESERRSHLSGLQRMLEGLAPSERAFDCVSYFNPTEQHTYERTVSAWADALVLLADESTLSPEEAAGALR